MIGRLLAARRAREKQNLPEVSVQQLNEEQKKQQLQQQIAEQQKEDFRKLHASCALVFAASFILFIIAVIILIPAVTYGDEVFFVAFGGFSLSGFGLLLIGCCFNDCCKSSDSPEGVYGEEQTSGMSGRGSAFKDSGISLCQSEAILRSYDQIPYNIPVRLEVPISTPIVVREYHNLPSVLT